LVYLTCQRTPAADNQPLTPEKLREQLGRLGGTPFVLGELTSRIEGDVMLPVSELNRLRRDVVGEAPRHVPVAPEVDRGCASIGCPGHVKRAILERQLRRFLGLRGSSRLHREGRNGLQRADARKRAYACGD